METPQSLGDEATEQGPVALEEDVVGVSPVTLWCRRLREVEYRVLLEH